jgi:purine-binding chemotaxis protein CheW
LPKAPEFLEGVLEYQGAAIPLIDLRKRLNVPSALAEETRTMVLEWDGGRVGVVVDTVTEVLEVGADEITPPPKIVKGLAAAYIAGLVVRNGRTTIVLNPGQLLSATERLALDAAVRTDGRTS